MQKHIPKPKITHLISSLILINERIQEIRLSLDRIDKKRWIDDVILAIQELELDDSNLKKQLIMELEKARDTNSTAMAELCLNNAHSMIYNHIIHLLLKLESNDSHTV